MLALIKRSALVIGLFAICWIATIIYWRSSHRIPAASDMIIYLIAVPLTLLFTFWVTKKVIAGFKKSDIGQTADSAGTADARIGDNVEGLLTLTVLGSALRSTAGNAPDALFQTILERETLPQLDKELSDNEGFPVLTGRIADIDESAVADEWSSWLATQGYPAHEWEPEKLRALGLGNEVVRELAEQLVSQEIVTNYLTANATQKVGIALPMLHLQTILPADWTEQEKKLGNEWLAYQIEHLGWPKEKLSIEIPTTDSRQSSSPLLQLDRLILDTHRQKSSNITLMMACESFIGEQTIEKWDSTNQLLTSRNHKGKIPSEGATALLLASAVLDDKLVFDNTAILHRVAHEQRQKSVEESGRINGDLIIKLCDDACTAADINIDAIKLVSSDTGNHPNRVAELLQAVQTHLPEIDPDTQIANVIAACGSAEAVSTLAALALAHTEAYANGHHALCISNQHTHERMAVVVSPLTSAAAV